MKTIMEGLRGEIGLKKHKLQSVITINVFKNVCSATPTVTEKR